MTKHESYSQGFSTKRFRDKGNNKVGLTKNVPRIGLSYPMDFLRVKIRIKTPKASERVPRIKTRGSVRIDYTLLGVEPSLRT